MTWEQVSRVLKFGFGLAWGTAELMAWGGRPYPLAFILMILIGTEAHVIWKHLPLPPAERRDDS